MEGNLSKRDLNTPNGWTTNNAMLCCVRASQFSFTTTTLGLTGYALNNFVRNKVIDYGLVISILCLTYLVIISIVTFFRPASNIPCVLLILETVFMILWFCAFIAFAAEWGPVSCTGPIGPSGGVYTYYHHYSHPCKCVQASIVMAAFAWVTFAISCFFLTWNIIIPMSKTYGLKSLWEPLGVRGIVVHKLAVLAISCRDSNDENLKFKREAQIDYSDQQILSSSFTGENPAIKKNVSEV